MLLILTAIEIKYLVKHAGRNHQNKMSAKRSNKISSKKAIQIWKLRIDIFGTLMYGSITWMVVFLLIRYEDIVLKMSAFEQKDLVFDEIF